MSVSNLLNLPPLDPTQPFMETFEEIFAPLLAHRAEGFRVIFSNLSTSVPLIVETGCLRSLANWSGDGQSTFMFDFLTKVSGGQTISIDANPASIAIAESVCSNTTFRLGDGATIINSLVQDDSDLSRYIDLLFLDSFDAFRDVSIIPAPVHYMLEFCAAWPLLSPGSLVAIDDFHSPETTSNVPGSKGLGVEMFLSLAGATVLHDEHLKVWEL